MVSDNEKHNLAFFQGSVFRCPVHGRVVSPVGYSEKTHHSVLTANGFKLSVRLLKSFSAFYDFGRKLIQQRQQGSFSSWKQEEQLRRLQADRR